MDAPTTPDHPTPPVPRPRTNTLDRKKLSETDSSSAVPPVLPPKPSNPQLPPKPGKPAVGLPPKPDTRPPPLPVKPVPAVANRWPPASKR